MIKRLQQKRLILIIAAMLVIACGQVINHYFPQTDFITGLFYGLGIGMLLAALFRKGLNWS